jgi:hypothetical protein
LKPVAPAILLPAVSARLGGARTPSLAVAPIPTFFQKFVEQFLTIVKIRALEPRECTRKVEQAALRCAREKAKRSGDLESFSPGRRCAFAVIDENQIGPESHP